jgi:hypothetical protein
MRSYAQHIAQTADGGISPRKSRWDVVSVNCVKLCSCGLDAFHISKWGAMENVIASSFTAINL